MKCLVYVGGFSNTIEVFELCHDSGGLSLTFKESSIVSANPSFLAKTPNGIYSVHEVSQFKGENNGGLAFSKIDETFKIRRIQEQFSCGSGPCHIAINNKRLCAYIANYESGHFGVTKLKKDGLLASGMFVESYDTGSKVVPDRQGESHPHGVCFRNQFVYLVDLGSDRIYHYEHGEDGNDFKASSIVYTSTPPGSGPRHMAFHPKYDIAFLITELSNEIIVYKFSSTDGKLTKTKSFSFITQELNQTADINYGAEIIVHPNGKFLYISNRGNGAIMSYHILDSEGSLEQIEVIGLEGTWPRHFNIHSSGKSLLCADQFKEEIYVFLIDDFSGKLTKIKTVTCKNKPSCIVFDD